MHHLFVIENAFPDFYRKKIKSTVEIIKKHSCYLVKMNSNYGFYIVKTSNNARYYIYYIYVLQKYFIL